jgi:hypothetical protein
MLHFLYFLFCEFAYYCYFLSSDMFCVSKNWTETVVTLTEERGNGHTLRDMTDKSAALLQTKTLWGTESQKLLNDLYQS